jgi:UDP-3-O-acyl-N-acetylglucosamine deacetylase
MTRRTLAAPVRVEGTGLFTGAPASVEFGPAPPGGAEGIVLESGGERFAVSVWRIDERPAHPAFAQMPPRSTALSASPDAAPVHTVEHALAALSGLAVTDAVVRIDGGELPIGDGSAELFTTPLAEAGFVELPGAIEPVVLDEPIVVEERGASVRLEPAESCSFEYRLDYGPGAPVPAGVAAWDGSPDAFARGIAPARTFCLQQEAEALHAMGLFRSLTPRDMLVFGAGGPIDNELRFPDEPARHKLLDMVGDLALVGRPIRARIVGERSGHALNREAARRVAALLA